MTSANSSKGPNSPRLSSSKYLLAFSVLLFFSLTTLAAWKLVHLPLPLANVVITSAIQKPSRIENEGAVLLPSHEAAELFDLAVRHSEPDTEIAATLALKDGGSFEFVYCAFADSGIDVCRKDVLGRVVWFRHCEELGVTHFSYQQHVTASVEGETVTVISQGMGGIFGERIDLANGRLLARSVYEP